MAPNLLSLPGEIRGLIYKYTLTEEDETLYYHEDQRSTGRLFLEEKVPDLMFQTVLKYFESGIGQPPNRYFDQVSKRTKSKLMRLIPNQLQFVCCQLRLETRRLSMKYNSSTLNQRRSDTSRTPHFLRSVFGKDILSPIYKCTGENLTDCYLCRLCRWTFRSMYKYNGIPAPSFFREVPPSFRFYPCMAKFDEELFGIFVEMQNVYLSQSMKFGSPIDTDFFVAWVKHWWENGV